jgi:hypothetical protein
MVEDLCDIKSTWTPNRGAHSCKLYNKGFTPPDGRPLELASSSTVCRSQLAIDRTSAAISVSRNAHFVSPMIAATRSVS